MPKSEGASERANEHNSERMNSTILLVHERASEHVDEYKLPLPLACPFPAHFALSRSHSEYSRCLVLVLVLSILGLSVLILSIVVLILSIGLIDILLAQWA